MLAKQWKAQKVGVKVVRELYGVQMSRGSAGSIMVTNGRFTEESRKFASDNIMEVIDGRKLERMIAEVQRSGRASPEQGQKAASSPREQEVTPHECPVCDSAMVRRVAKRGANACHAFWGCPQYPACRGTRRSL